MMMLILLNWFAKFRSGNFDVEDAPRSGRPVEADKYAIKALVDTNRRIKTQRNLCRRIDVCDSLLKRHENDPFLKRILTGDEKGHGAKKMNRLKPFPKPIFTKKVYCHQLDKLNDALQQKRSELVNRKGVVFHQDKARPHTSLVTCQKLLQLEWDTMPHPPYSPDLAPSDYYLFRSLQNFFKTFTSNEEVKNHLDQFFASKDQTFYERGIMLLPERWQKGVGPERPIYNLIKYLFIIRKLSFISTQKTKLLSEQPNMLQLETQSHSLKLSKGFMREYQWGSQAVPCTGALEL
ncbi:histone-lysine N-methyltransferase SETMAR [Trichonephila clavipes]|nr:histone-lysine N-methyltransferase SETMAR [Trichonephila clavipes]